MPNWVSACCNRSVDVGHGIDYPLGGNRWGKPYKYEFCTSCGMKFPELVEECDQCGVVGCKGDCE